MITPSTSALADLPPGDKAPSAGAGLGFGFAAVGDTVICCCGDCMDCRHVIQFFASCSRAALTCRILWKKYSCTVLQVMSRGLQASTSQSNNSTRRGSSIPGRQEWTNIQSVLDWSDSGRFLLHPSHGPPDSDNTSRSYSSVQTIVDPTTSPAGKIVHWTSKRQTTKLVTSRKYNNTLTTNELTLLQRLFSNTPCIISAPSTELSISVRDL